MSHGNKNNKDKRSTLSSNIDKTNTSSESKGIYAISHHEDRKYDTISFRMDFIKDLLKDNSLDSVIDFDNLETETFIHPNGYLKKSSTKDDSSNGNLFVEGSNGSKSVEDNDIRNILNKKNMIFIKFLMNSEGN